MSAALFFSVKIEFCSSTVSANMDEKFLNSSEISFRTDLTLYFG